MRFIAIVGGCVLALTQAASAVETSRSAYDAMIAAHAQANGVPESLVHRVVVRESRYNPRAIGRGGAMGMMQIKTATARGVGYTGTASGLLDPNTNLTYAVRYLAGAYRVAGGNHDRAVQLYARGYYHAAKRQGVPAYAAAPGVFAAAGPDDALAARGEVARPASKRISMLTGQPDSGL